MSEIIENYIKQAQENHQIKIEKNFDLVVKKKPKYMPLWLYKMVIKDLIEFRTYK